jgi:hypothetical protein
MHCVYGTNKKCIKYVRDANSFDEMDFATSLNKGNVLKPGFNGHDDPRAILSIPVSCSMTSHYLGCLMCYMSGSVLGGAEDQRRESHELPQAPLFIIIRYRLNK